MEPKNDGFPKRNLLFLSVPFSGDWEVTPLKFNSSPLKNDGYKTTFPLGW